MSLFIYKRRVLLGVIGMTTLGQGAVAATLVLSKDEAPVEAPESAALEVPDEVVEKVEKVEPVEVEPKTEPKIEPVAAKVEEVEPAELAERVEVEPAEDAEPAEEAKPVEPPVPVEVAPEVPVEEPPSEVVRDAVAVLCGPGTPCVELKREYVAFPGNTRKSETREIDRYACKPGANESGPEDWYRLTVTQPGFFVAKLTPTRGDKGVDVDIHLLSGKEGSTCIKRAHKRLATRLEPGSYWVVIDSWQDESGRSRGGRYTLNALHMVRTSR